MSEPMPEGLSLSLLLPDWLRLAIADAVVLFGRIEQELIEIGWLLNDPTVQDKVKLARKPATENFVSILETIEALPSASRLDALREGFSELANERNLIVHGSWIMAGERPWVAWHKFVEDSDSVAGWFFDQGRFERFSAKGQAILKMLRQFHAMLEAQAGRKTSALPRA